MTGDSERYTLVTNGAALEEAARRWAGSPVLGLDTEFVRTSTFYHCLGLIQVSDGRSSCGGRGAPYLKRRLGL